MARDESRVQVSDEVVEGYKADFVTVGKLGHIITEGFMDPDIRPIVQDVKVVGRAVTVSMPSIHPGANRIAVDTANPGDVIVVDCVRDDRVARWGEMICFDAKCKGLAGIVIDGAATASGPIRKMRFPVFSRTVVGLTGRRTGPVGTVNVTVQCGGVTVSPGDLIVADDDGVLAIPAAEAEELLETCRERYGTGKSDSARRWIMSGRPYSAFPGLGWEERDDLPEPTRTPIVADEDQS